MRINTAVLVSGGGTNLQALIDYEQQKGDSCPYKIVCVISDHKDAFALERAAKAGIPTTVRSPYAVMGKEAAQAAEIWWSWDVGAPCSRSGACKP